MDSTGGQVSRVLLCCVPLISGLLFCTMNTEEDAIKAATRHADGLKTAVIRFLRQYRVSRPLRPSEPEPKEKGRRGDLSERIGNA